MNNSKVIVFEDVVKDFRVKSGRVLALTDLSFTVREGEFLVIVGPSGCGKSTALRLLSGLMPASGGRILAHGRPVIDVQDDIGMVFQSPTLLPWRTVLGNVLLPATVRRLDMKQCQAAAEDLLELAGLKGFERAYPHQLSGGMQHRVALCRALLTDPAILLMDEPFAALDALTRDQMNLELLRIWNGRPGKTVLFVTHSIQEAVFLADRVMVMSPRPGRVLEVFDIDFPRPRSLGLRSTPRFQELVTEVGRLLGVTEATVT